MAELIVNPNSFKSNRPFYDDRHYPRGISRSGDYSMSEVKILEQYGVVLLALSDGSQEAITDEERRFVSVVQGQQEAETKIEKAWLKYLSKTRQPKKFHTLFGSSKVASSDNDADDDSESDNDDINETVTPDKIDLD